MTTAIVYGLTVLLSLVVIGRFALAFADRYDRANGKTLRADLERNNDELREAILAAERDFDALNKRVDKLLEARNLRAAGGATGGRV